MKSRVVKIFMVRFFIVLVTLFYLYAGYLYQTIESRKNIARTTASEAMQQFEMILDGLIEKTNMIESYIHYLGDDQMRIMFKDHEPYTFYKEFNMLSAMLYDSAAIKAFQIAPNGVVTFCYPIDGNEEVIGYDILHDEALGDGPQLSVSAGLLDIDGPVALRQGGTGLIVRNPVFYKNGEFWGFATIVLSLPDVIEPFGFNDLARKGYQFILEVESDKRHEVIADNIDKDKLDDAVEVTKMIAGRKATLRLAPDSSWFVLSKAWYQIAFFLVLSLFISYLLTRNKVSSLRIVEALENEKNLRKITAQAYYEAEQANTAKSDFLSAMSHDLRTPMNAIVGLCILLEREANNPQKVLDYVRKLKGSSHHLLGLINDILDMSKIESGKVALNVREFSIATLIDNINNIVRPQANDREQVFEIFVEGIEHEFLIADDLRLNQIILNLLSNAIKYTHNGGRISLKVTEHKMRSPSIAMFEFEIVDNGMGMSQEFLKHVFEPFVRSKDVQGTAIQGTGLGMAITHNLIKLMGGTVEIHSAVGEGTRVNVRLPMKVRIEALHDSIFFKQLGIQNILLIDDDADAGSSVTTIMAEAGVKVVHAFNEQEAFEKLKAAKAKGEDINLILLDLKLGEQNGIDVAKALKDSEFSDILVILLTAFDYDDVELDAIENGVAGFIRKPLFLSNLKPTLESIYGHKSSDSSSECECCFKGLHILAAEDNELNSEILIDILSMQGATCDVCVNGKEIAEKFETTNPGDYDLILMDVQMPVLNGLEATKLIRASSRPHAKTIPIIAMTANAFSDDIKASIDAGMNYHISKPIDIKVLEQTIRKLNLRPRAAASAPDANAAAVATANTNASTVAVAADANAAAASDDAAVNASTAARAQAVSLDAEAVAAAENVATPNNATEGEATSGADNHGAKQIGHSIFMLMQGQGTFLALCKSILFSHSAAIAVVQWNQSNRTLMSQRCFNKQDTHCHLLLGLKELDLSAHSRLNCAQNAIDAAIQDQNLPQVLSTDELASYAISRRINSFLMSDIDCFYCFSTCYKDAKACYEVLEYYSEKIETANKTIYLGLGLHPFNVSSEYAIELNALEILIERIQNHRPDIMPVLGEVGLDKRIEVPLQLQIKCVKDFITKTQAYKKPYSFHCVRAQNELDALISSFGKDALEVIIHGFNGSYGAAMSCLNKGYKLGLGSSLLAEQNASKFAKIIKDAYIKGLQNTHLLLESDFDGSKTQDYDASLLTKLEHQLQSLTNI